METMRGIILLGIASGVISFTLAEMHIFQGLRSFMNRKSDFFGSLFSCPFCLSFWISGVICMVYKPNVIHQINILDEIITYFIVCGISAFVGLIFKCLFRLADGV
jgi:hypothetical protein